MCCAAPAAATTCSPDAAVAAEYDNHAGPIVCGGSRCIRYDSSAGGSVPRRRDDQAGPAIERPFRGRIPTDGSWNGKYQQTATADSPVRSRQPASRIRCRVATRRLAPTMARQVPRREPRPSSEIRTRCLIMDIARSRPPAILKAIVSALMGQAPSRSYFVGCSDGGREALQEAQRFPEDFDGIIAGSPVNDQVGEFGASYLFNSQATLSGPQTNGVPDAYIPTSKLPLLTNAVLARCVGKDGGVAGDTFLNDPRQCKFDPSSVQCSAGQDPNTCLTPAQVQAAPEDLRWPARQHNSEPAIPGLEPGGEAPDRKAGPHGSPVLRPHHPAANSHSASVSDVA